MIQSVIDMEIKNGEYMKVPITPLADYLVVKTKEKVTKTASGLYLPDNASQESSSVEVVAIGKEVTTVKVGDKIIYKNEYDAVKVTIVDKDYYLVKLENVIAKVGA